jgi:SSS family solute:Na+ symporter
MITWIVFLSYSFITILLGWLSHKKKDRNDEFWTAGRGLSGLSAGLSISAGFMSVSWSCVYAVQLFYWYGLGGLWLVTIPWLIALSGIYILSKKYHKLPAFSQPEMVAQRFGKGSKRTVATALAFVFLVWGGAEIYVAAALLAPGLAISIKWVILIICVVVAIYTTLGGFRAVVMTDKLQYAIVAFYVLAMVWLAGKGLAARGVVVPDFSLTAAKSGKSWLHFTSPGLTIIILTLIAYLPAWLFETDLWLRVQAAKDEKAAKKGMLIAGINGFFFVGVFPLFIGVAALSIFPMEGNSFPGIIGSQGDAIFSALVSTYAPAWLAVLAAVGLVAAAMSTIDTCINVMALSIGYDIVEVHKGRHPESGAKLITLGSVFFAYLFAIGINSLWDIFYLASGVLTTAVAFPVAAVFIKKVKRKGVLYSSISGFAATVLFYFLESRGLLNFIEPRWLVESGLGYILWGIIFALLGYLLGAKLRANGRNYTKTNFERSKNSSPSKR